MANELVPIEQAQGALAMRERMAKGQALNTNFSEGVRDAFPLLSIKGKVFRARISGQETPFIDPTTRQAISFLDVVLVNGSKMLSKTYYIAGYSEGSLEAPDCWSLDSIRPDPSVANKVSLTCVNCKMNQFGSKISDAGKPVKACQDARRIAVVMPHQINAPEPLVLMLRIPATSLKNLKVYADLLKRYGFEPNGCVTRLAFDYVEAYPKLVFNFVRPLDDGQYGKVTEMAESVLVQGMLSAPDFEMVATQPVKQADNVAGLVPQEGPVLADPTLVRTAADTAPVLDTQTVAVQQGQTIVDKEGRPDPAKATLQALASTVIELPEGKLFDTATGQYVERTQPSVQMPQLDPETVALPNGQFFSKTKKAYVTGPELGAPAMTDAAAAAPPAKTRTRKPKEPVATAAATAAAAKQPDNAPPPALAAAAEADQKAAQSLVAGAVANQNIGGSPPANGDATPTASTSVVAAPQGLEDILNQLLPPANQ